jgi:hypothetical protein
VTIEKYRVPMGKPTFSILMPAAHQFLVFRMENDWAFVYVLVDQESPVVPVAFRLITTGEPIRPDEFQDARYVGTFLPNGFPTVHLFTVANREEELSRDQRIDPRDRPIVCPAGAGRG